METMNRCNLFKDLNEMKSEMGITNEVNKERDMKNNTKTKYDKKKKKLKNPLYNTIPKKNQENVNNIR